MYNSLSNVHGISQNLLLNSLLPPPPPLNHTQTKWQKFSLVCLPVFHANLCTVDSRYLDLPYLEVKIWSLLWHGNLKTGIKILSKRGEIAPKEQFLIFSTIFSVHVHLLTLGVRLHIHLLNVVVRFIVFLN